ncbi:MAG: hypothetical protein ACHREM_05615 [Polyangiales bacterium]
MTDPTTLLLGLVPSFSFAIQRAVEILDAPLQACAERLAIQFPGKVDAQGVARAAVFKRTVTGITSTAFGCCAAAAAPGPLDAVLGNHSPGVILIAGLCLGAGTDGANSITKYLQYTKDAKRPPDVCIALVPSAITLARKSRVQFLPLVSGADDTSVAWRITEADGGAIGQDGQYTAPDAPGTYHVSAISNANVAKLATATVTVNA